MTPLETLVKELESHLPKSTLTRRERVASNLIRRLELEGYVILPAAGAEHLR